jgi:hypothetical protein
MRVFEPKTLKWCGFEENWRSFFSDSQGRGNLRMHSITANLIQIAALGLGISLLALWVDHLKASKSQLVSTKQLNERRNRKQLVEND